MGLPTDLGFWAAAAKGTAFVVLSAAIVFLTARREVHALIRSARLLDAVAEATTDAVVVKDAEGRYLFCNVAAARLVGKPAAEILSGPNNEQTEERDQRIRTTGRGEEYEERLAVSGRERTFHVVKAPYRDARGDFAGVVAVSRDVTDRKDAEQQLRTERDRFEKIMEAAPVVIYSFHQRADGTECCPYASRRIEEIYGLSPEQLAIDSTPVYKLLHPDDVGRVIESVAESARALTVWRAEFRVQHRSRGEVWVEGCSTPVRQPDGSVVWHGYLSDVTDRKRTELALRESEERFRALVENAVDGIFLHGERGVVVDANDWACKSLGYTRGELIGKLPEELDTTATPETGQKLTETLRRGEPVTFDGIHRRKDGSTFPVEVRARAVVFEGRRLWMSIARDITDRNRAEEERARLAAIVESSLDAIVSKTPDGIIQTWNPGAERLFGYTAADVVGKSITLIVPSERHAEEDMILTRIRAGERIDHFDTVRVTKDGRRIAVSLTVSPIRDASGRVVGASKVARDITDRVRAEEAVRESERRFRETADTAPVAIWETNPDMLGTFLSRGWQELTGQDSVDGLGLGWLAMTHPDDAAATEVAFRSANARREAADVDYRVRRSDGSYGWVVDRARPRFGPDGEYLGMIGAVIDIDARKRAEEALRASEARFRNVFENAATGIAIADLTGRFVQCNPGFCNLVGYTEEELRTIEFSSLVHEEDRVANLAGNRRVATGESPRFETENRYVHKSGESVLVHKLITLLPAPTGKPAHLMALVTDVTERRRAEEALRASEARFRATADVAPVAIWETDANNIGTFASRGWQELTGQTPAEAIGTGWLAVTHPDDAAAAAVAFQTANERREGVDFDYRLRRADGAYRWATDRGRPRFGPGGEYLGMVGVVFDIDARKQAEEAVRESEERFRGAFENAPIGIALVSPEGRWLKVNWVLCQMLGYTAEELLATDFQSVTHPEDLGKSLELVQQVWGGTLATYQTEKRYTHKAGFVVHVLLAVSPVRDAGGGTRHCVVQVVDITDRKRAEEARRESEERFRTLVEYLPDAIFLNVDGRVVFCNPACVRLFGAAGPEGLIGKTPFDLHPPERHDTVRLRIAAQQATDEPVPGVEEEVLRLDGARVPVYFRALPISERGIKSLLVVLHDLTEQKRLDAQLRHQALMIREAGELAHVGGWGFDPATGQGDWTPEAFRIHGLPPRPTISVAEGLSFYCGEDRGRIEAAMATASASGTPYDLELQLTAADGARKWVRTICRPTVEGDKVVRVRGSIQDITDRKRAEEEIRALNTSLEQRVRDRTAELESVNRELESFSYSVSHDLRAPIRHITGFTNIVLEECGPQLPAESRGYLEQVAAAAGRMGRLVDDLLAFSRLGRQPVRRQHVDIRRLVDDCLREVLQFDENRRVETRVGELPTCDGDPALLRQAWMNLLSNAVKYSGKRDLAVIEVGATPTLEGTAYFVKDNGVGFDMQYAHKLFGVFQRLHKVEEFKGTGIGLALVQRIIHRHGGRVWAEAEPGTGATFWFTLGPPGEPSGSNPG